MNRTPSTYQCLQQRQPLLKPHRDPAALLDHLHARHGDPNAKNELLKALVQETGDDRLAEFCTSLLLLALWPGLDAVRGRLLRHVRGDVAWLDTELIGRLSLAVRTCDLDRVTRVAATLLMNIERDLRRELVKAGRERTSPEESAAADDDPVEQLALSACRGLGRDGPLVVAVALLGFDQKEAASALGLTHEQARKRYRRAISRLRMSHAASETGFSPSTASSGRRST